MGDSDSQKLLVVYASTSGNVELVCEKVKSVLEKKNCEVKMIKAELATIDDILKYNKLMFATSTWDHGIINPYFDRLLKEMKSADFTGTTAGFIGLGDRSYEPIYFCTGIDILRRVYLSRGGKELFHTLKINGVPHDYLESEVKNWAEEFLKEII